MGLNFRKSITKGGARINLSKSGAGASYGTKGARITRTAKGKTKATVSIPGTGLSYSTEVGGGKEKSKTWIIVFIVAGLIILWAVAKKAGLIGFDFSDILKSFNL
ncbi:MAG: DUF4236 domain-containing protein [Lachnospiraceae bacterium]|nr:DUF4236 domain-containing protein [Lachnospiraceae bacterium]MBO4462116.1 DUF4236 domain-containing protein [Lachnospiraceae bacterium]MBR5789614.1 DUF4236 domain-containing protein [Lachnospiraceae bacterium]